MKIDGFLFSEEAILVSASEGNKNTHPLRG